jgi:hypothetical protein
METSANLLMRANVRHLANVRHYEYDSLAHAG